MHNILIRFLRESKVFTQKSVAEKIGVSIGFYQGIECGRILFTPKQARQMGELFNIHSSYISKSAGQLDLLLAKIAQAKILKAEIKRLNYQLEKSGIMEEKKRP